MVTLSKKACGVWLFSSVGVVFGVEAWAGWWLVVGVVDCRVWLCCC